jgi:hypothetical protein
MTRAAVALLLLTLGLGCSEPTERTPATCMKCGVYTGGGVGVPGSGGSAGSGNGDAGAGAVSGVTLTGRVILLDDFGFETGPLLDETAALKAQAKGGGTVAGEWNGLDEYVLDNVLSDPLTWVSITPASSTGEGLPTLVPANTTKPASDGRVTLNLAVVGRTVVDTILDILTVPTARDPSKAILILEVRKLDGTPLAGVTVTAPTAETIVYGAAGTFTDDATATDASGLVLLVNVPASAWPGTLVGVTFDGALEGGADVRAITGAVTLEGITP